MAWAEALAAQTTDPVLGARFAPVAEALIAKRDVIEHELLDDQGHPNDIGGYYRPDAARASAAMRPSATFNAVLAMLTSGLNAD
jgi:isocitrate dehydrogenase